MDDILYTFIGSKAKIKKSEINSFLSEFGVDSQYFNKIFELLLWYGFIGVLIDEEAKYIYDFNYSMKLVAGLIKKKGNIDYLINPDFWPALMIGTR